VKAFHLKKDLKSIFSNRRQLYVARGAVTPCLFCFVSFEAICDRYFFKLYSFKLIGWFYHHIAFHQSDQFGTDFCSAISEHYTVRLQNIALWLQNIALRLQNITLWLQNIIIFILKSMVFPAICLVHRSAISARIALLAVRFMLKRTFFQPITLECWYQPTNHI
jgi:hypothetical protein